MKHECDIFVNTSIIKGEREKINGKNKKKYY